jgi:hypothetical protein
MGHSRYYLGQVPRAVMYLMYATYISAVSLIIANEQLSNN